MAATAGERRLAPGAFGLRLDLDAANRDSRPGPGRRCFRGGERAHARGSGSIPRSSSGAGRPASAAARRMRELGAASRRCSASTSPSPPAICSRRPAWGGCSSHRRLRAALRPRPRPRGLGLHPLGAGPAAGGHPARVSRSCTPPGWCSAATPCFSPGRRGQASPRWLRRCCVAVALLLSDDAVALGGRAREPLLAHPGRRLPLSARRRAGAALRRGARAPWRVGCPSRPAALRAARRLRTGAVRGTLPARAGRGGPAIEPHRGRSTPLPCSAATFNLSVRTPERLTRQLDVVGTIAATGGSSGLAHPPRHRRHRSRPRIVETIWRRPHR